MYLRAPPTGTGVARGVTEADERVPPVSQGAGPRRVGVAVDVSLRPAFALTAEQRFAQLRPRGHVLHEPP